MSTHTRKKSIKKIRKPLSEWAQSLVVDHDECNRTGLDPFGRQIYSIKRGNQMTTLKRQAKGGHNA